MHLRASAIDNEIVKNDAMRIIDPQHPKSLTHTSKRRPQLKCIRYNYRFYASDADNDFHDIPIIFHAYHQKHSSENPNLHENAYKA